MRNGFLIAMVVAAACQSSSEQQIPLNGSAQDLFTVTRVLVENGEARVVHTSSVTRGEQVNLANHGKQMSVAGDPLRQGVNSDPLCYGADMWIWDQAYEQGNELCVAG